MSSIKLKSPARPVDEDETGLPSPGPTVSTRFVQRPEAKPKRTIRIGTAPASGSRSSKQTHSPKAGAVAKATERFASAPKLAIKPWR